jgi:hypothetical protein
MQGQEAKYTEGVISSLSGAGNNPRYFQISTAVQPGNSESLKFKSKRVKCKGVESLRGDVYKIIMGKMPMPR